MSGADRHKSASRDVAATSQRLPSGSVTFVFTDVEASTRHLRELGDDDYADALEQYRAILTEAISHEGGVLVDTQGDGLFAAFADAASAASMAVSAQAALAGHAWPQGREFRARCGLHTGRARHGASGYVGLAVHQAARIAAAAHGGQVVASGTTVAAVEPRDDLAWRSLGSHRLKDLGAPVEIYQLCHPLLPTDFPPLRSLESATHNLPLQLSTFVGRSEELAVGSKLLDTARLVTITGTGGTGKTRLALQLAAENVGRFPGGIFVVELAPLRDGRLVPRAAMSAVGLPDEGGRSETESVVAFLERRQALLLLDNCEHVADDAGIFALEVLSRCPNVRLLATSRTPLQLPGESVWTLGPLRFPERDERHLGLLAGADAVALFCERAAEARVGFALSEENADLVSEICSRLEGLPLALELAAARVRTVPLAEIVRRLESGLDLLSKGARASHPRQLSVRATLAWSHELLSGEEQVLFRRLAVFRGGFDLAAAEEICSDRLLEATNVLATLEGLVDKSLVKLLTSEDEEGRYRLLEPVRAYAAERLSESEEGGLLADRHADYFIMLLREGAAVHSRRARLAEVELANVLAALDRLASSRDLAAHGGAVCDFWTVVGNTGHFRIAQRELKRFFDRGEGEPLHRVRAARYYGNLALNLAEHDEARRWHDEALLLARRLGDSREVAVCLRNCAQDAYRRDAQDEAEAYLDEALAIAAELEDRLLHERCTGTLGLVKLGRGRAGEAAVKLGEALAIAAEIDADFRLVWQMNLASALTEVGRYAEAEAQLRPLCEETTKATTRCDAYVTLGDLHLRCGRYRDARPLLEAGREQAEELSYLNERCTATTALGELALELGRDEEAARLLDEACSLAEEIGARSLSSRAVASSGWLAFEEGDYLRGQRLLEESLEHADRSGNLLARCYAVGSLGALATRRGLLDEAEARTSEAIALAEEIEDPGSEARWRAERAALLLRLSRPAAAAGEITRALRLSSSLGELHACYLEVAAAVLAAVGSERSAARALGAAEAQEASVGGHPGAWERARLDSTASRCEAALGKEAFRSALAAGRGLGWEAAVSGVLEALTRVASAGPVHAPGAG